MEGRQRTVESLVNFWKGKKVFITGATGFKGSWLSIWLTKLGAEVTGYSLKPETESMFNICNTGTKINNIIADINNLTDLKRALKGHDVVFHLAAQALVRESYDKPIYTMQTNIMGTANVLEACRDNQIQSIVIITTDKVYENKEWLWGYRENDRLGGYDPYSTSKAASELVADCYRSSFNMPVATARAGNVIGGGDFASDRLIPDCIRHSQMCQTLHIRNPKATRPFQYILDVLRGYLLLAQNLYNDDSFAQAFNFGASKSYSVLDVVNMVSQHITLEYKFETSYLHEAGNLSLVSDLAYDWLDWFAEYDLYTAIDDTITWYRNYYENKDMYEFTISQIGDYEDGYTVR
jgi:CDP-glucose 4,6-dehydratase